MQTTGTQRPWYMLVLLVIHVLVHNPISGANKGGSTTVPADQHPFAYFIIGGTCTGREYDIGECKGISYPSTCDDNSRKGWVDCQPGKSLLKLITACMR